MIKNLDGRFVATAIVFLAASGTCCAQRQECRLFNQSTVSKMDAHHIAYALAITKFMTAVELSQAEQRGLGCEFPPAQGLRDIDNAISWRVNKFAQSDEKLKSLFIAFWASSGQNSLSSSIATKWLIHNNLMARFNAWDAADVRQAWTARSAEEIEAAKDEERSKALKERSKALKAERAAKEQAVRSKTTWTDPSTGLMWTTKDDGGESLTGEKAETFCRELSLEGHTDWRLPTIDELQTLYDPSVEVYYENGEVSPLHIKGDLRPLNKRYYYWSSSDSPNPGSYAIASKWEFEFRSGKRNSAYITYPPNYVGGNALCVRP